MYNVRAMQDLWQAVHFCIMSNYAVIVKGNLKITVESD